MSTLQSPSAEPAFADDQPSLRILHLAAADHGGAGVAAWRIHDALRQRGHQSRMLVLERRTNDNDVLDLGQGRSSYRWRRLAVKAWLRLASRPDPYFQDQDLSVGLDVEAALQTLGMRPDVIVVHYISHFLAANDVLALHKATGASVIWHLLDMGLLTGGCHYAWECMGYKQRCGHCPALRLHRPGADLSRRIWLNKSKATAETPGCVIAGSSLLEQQARMSSLFVGRHVQTLLLGVSDQTFKPQDQSGLRVELGVGDAQQLIFFGAQKFNQRRKGMSLLLKALENLASIWPVGRALPVLLSAGNATDFSPLRRLGFKLIELGFIGTPVLAKAYAAADIFVCPSIEDSGPMMINEAMMSGTPVVAFRMGVAPDLIEDGVTGVIAPLGDVTALAKGMTHMLLQDESEHRICRQRCREVALSRCEAGRQAARFAGIAQDLVKSHGRQS